MTEKEILMAAIKAAGYEPVEYSGRFMFGAKCVGFSVDSIVRATAEVVGNRPDVLHFFAGCRTDDLGKESIIYFPLVAW